MPTVSSPSYQDYFSKLPSKARNELAEATGKKSAYTATNVLLKTLKNPDVVKQLPKDQFESKKNKNGQIKFWTRTGLAFKHFFNTLFTRFDQMGKDFAALVRAKKTGQAAPPPGATNRTPATRTVPSGLRGRIVDIATSALGASIGSMVGNMISHFFTKDENKADNAEADGADGSDDAKDADESGKTEDAKGVDNDKNTNDETASDADGTDAGPDDADAESGGGGFFSHWFHRDSDGDADSDGGDGGD